MKLKSFGCSFVFGTDLADDGRNRPYATGSRLTWPALIAKHFGYAYETYARPGSGNLQILERLLCQIDAADPAIYVIGWTYIDRFDYINDLLATPWPGTKWSTLMPIDQTPMATDYFRNLNSEYADKLRTLIYIKTAIDRLQQNNCPFIMTSMDTLVNCQRWHNTRATLDLQKYVRPYLNNFSGKTFLDWSREQNFPISDTMHPLEQAHEAAADLVLTEWSDWLKR